ncbi:MAG: response regulator [Candidatus Eisenbacteria bacterium]
MPPPNTERVAVLASPRFAAVLLGSLALLVAALATTAPAAGAAAFVLAIAALAAITSAHDARSATETERRRVEAELRSATQRLDFALGGAGTAAWELDLASNAIWASPEVERVLGFAPQPHERGPEWFEQRLHPEDRDSWSDCIASLVTDAVSRELELRLVRPTGEARWFRLRASAEAGAEGLPVRIRALLSDVTDQRFAENRIRESEESFRSLSAASPVGILKADASGQCSYCNEQWQALSGLSEFEAMGDGWLDAIHPDDRERVEGSWREFVMVGGTFEQKFRLCDADDEVRWVHARGNSVLDALCAVTGFVVTYEDETEARTAEIALADARDRAMQAAKAKSEFLANMSHEIRTPLNGVIGMTELLQGTALGDEQRDFVRTIHTSADALLSIINDILDFSKIEAGKLTIEKVDLDLRTLGEDVAELLAPRARDRGLELVLSVEPDVPRHLVGDPVRIRQILLNLATNAIKFTEQGEVVISAQRLAGDERHCRVKLSVRDSGIGIRADRLDAVFESFTQADGSTTRKYGGTGLGLTICRQLAELMGGTIHVQSTYGSGSEFWVELPFAVAEGSAREYDVTCDLSGAHVLVVDDHPVNRRVLFETLRGWGVRPECASNGEEALAKLAHDAQDPFVAVLMDYRMPVMDGIETARRAVKLPGAERRAVLMLSSSGSVLTPEEQAAAGLRGWVAKPVREAALHRVLCGVLGHQVPGAGPVQTEAAEDFSGLALLLAEDNEVNRKVALRMLQKLGCSADVAMHGREALDRTAERDYDLVFMDCQMPEMDGFEATRSIRERERGGGRRVRIVAMTANAMQGDRERCLEAGMDDYVAKPVKLERLQEQLRLALNERDPGMDRAA